MANAFDKFDKKNKFDQFDNDPKALTVATQYLAGINETTDAALRFIPNTMKAGVQIITGRGSEPFEPVGKTIFGEAADALQPKNKVERIARGAGNITGDAATVLAAGPIATQKALSMGQTNQLLANPSVKNAARLIVDDIAAFFAKNPGKASIEEATLATLGGLGFSAAAEETSNAALQTVAGMTAATSPKLIANSLTGQVVRGASWLAKRLSREAQVEAAKAEVKNVLGQEITEGAVKSINDKTQLEQDVPGLELTLAEKTESPSLVAMQKALEDKATGAELEHMVARRENNVLAIQQYSNDAAPIGEPSPDYIVDVIDSRLTSLDDTLEGAKANLNDKARAAANIGETDRSAQGVKIRDRFKQLKSDKAEEMSAAAKQLGVLDIDVTDDFVMFTKNLSDELKPQSVLSDGKNIPDAMTDLQKVVRARVQENIELKKAGKESKPFTFRDIKAFRERLGDSIRDEMQSANPKVKKVRDLVIAKERLDDFMDTLASEGTIPPDLAEKYEAFRNLYKLEYIDRFENGAAFRMKQRGQGDFYKTLDEKVSDVFFQPGGITRAREFKAAFEGDQEAVDALEASVIDRMKSAVVKDGVINETAFKNWTQKHDSVLREFPEIRNRVKNIESANQQILGRQAQIHAREKFLQSRALRRKLDSVKKDAKTSDSLLQDSLKNQKVLDQVLKSIQGDQEASQGFKRWMWDQATNGSPEAIKRFIFDNESSLKKVLGDSHFENIKTILRAEDAITVVPPSQGQEFRPIPFRQFEETTGISIPSAVNRGYALQSGRVQKQWLWAETIVKSINAQKTKEMDALMKRALYDSEFAKLLAEPSISLKDRERKKLNLYLYQMGIAPYTETE